MNTPISSTAESGCAQVVEPRRGFLSKLLALTLGAVAYATPAVAGIWAFLWPLRQKGQGGRLLRLASLETLPDDGTPRKVAVITDRSDAWARYPSEPVGAVFLRRVGKEVEALHVTCPHAGCGVEYDAGGKKFFCPCHSASFDLEGKRLDATSPSPRDLDTLQVEIRNQTEVWVKFQKFLVGTAEKVAQT